MKFYKCEGPLACDGKVFAVEDDEEPLSCPYCDTTFLEKSPIDLEVEDKRFKGFSEDELQVLNKALDEASFRSGYMFEDGKLDEIIEELKEARDQ